MLRKQKNKKGFTIIEVVLVLAVAGLIFLMVFVALPALQRNQRDTQRRQDYGDLSSAISGYMSSNGYLPKPGTNLAPDKYVNKDGLDPNRVAYVIKVCEAASASNVKCKSGDSASEIKTPEDHEVYVVTKATCNGVASDGAARPEYINSGRSFAIYGFMESTGTYCQASS